MKVQLRRFPDGFRPDSQRDAECLDSVHVGEVIYGDFRQPRNPAHHRKAFALLHHMFEWQDHEQNQKRFDKFERFYDWVKVKAGLVDLVEINEQGAVYKLQSLSWASMGQERFDKAYQAIITVAFEELGMEHVLVEYA